MVPFSTPKRKFRVKGSKLSTSGHSPSGKKSVKGSKLRSVGSWLPFNIREFAFNTVEGLANATGRDLLGFRMTTETIETPNGPETAMFLDYDAPVPEKNTATESALSRRDLRLQNLEAVHQYFESITHRAAIDAIQRSADENLNLALYLRGFTLAAEREYVPGDHQFSMYSGRAVFSTTLRREDSEFQKAIIQAGVDLIVGIANPEDPTPSDTIPQFMLTNGPWVPTVKGLVNWCVPIFVFIEKPSEGVFTELELIIEGGKTAQTIIVHSPPSGEQLGVGGALVPPGDVAPKLRRRWKQTLRRFPHCIEWSEMDNRLTPAIRAAYMAPSEQAQQEPVPIPIEVNFGPPNAEADAVAKYGGSILEQGERLARSGQLREGEDLIYRAAVCAFIANSDLLRATSYMYLGKCAEMINDVRQSIMLYGWAKDLASRLGWTEIASLADQKIKIAESGVQ